MEKIIIGALEVANWLYYNTSATLTLIIGFVAVCMFAYVKGGMTHD